MSHDLKQTRYACSKQRNVQTLRWPAKSLDLNPVDKLLDQLKRKVRTQPLQLNLRELMRVIHQMCAAIPHQYIHRNIVYK